MIVKHNKAFTMIELIFVILIIGLLASIAIPKMAQSRVDAQASLCTLEIRQLTVEIYSAFTAYGHALFTNKPISKITSINILSNSQDSITGIISDTYLVSGVNYKCDGNKIANFIYSYNSVTNEYKMVLELQDGLSPASNKAFTMLKKFFSLDGDNSKYYIF